MATITSDNPYLVQYYASVQLGITDMVSQMFDLRFQYAFAIPTNEALDAIANYGPIVEIGAGNGYWASLLFNRGVDIIAFDIAPPANGDNIYFTDNQQYFAVQQGDVSVASRYPERALFLCWPPYDSPMAYNALQAYNGDTLIYIGEGPEGCTGDDAFHNALSDKWTDVEAVFLPQWESIHDFLIVYKRK